MKFAKRMDDYQAGIFQILNEKKIERIQQGLPVYNLSVGTPDFEPPAHVKQAFIEACAKSENYKYSLVDIPELKEAVINWYQRRYGVTLKENQFMSVYGSQEGITHLTLALCDHDDIILAPTPCYPIFNMGPELMGAHIEYYELKEENNYLIDFDHFDLDLAKKAKAMIVSYPANPVGAVANRGFYERLVQFAKENDLIIIHDNAYSEIIFDGNEGISFLSIPGAMDVGVEFNSLSKTYNLTGARISFCLGNEEIIKNFNTVRSQIDYGIFLPVQYGAIAALNGPQDSVEKQRLDYQARRDALCGGCRSIGWNVPDSKGSMFVWARIPERYQDSTDFTMQLLEKTGVIVTPGGSFGPAGDRYVRMALVQNVENIKKIIRIIDESGLVKDI